jgi:NHL repeat
MKASRLLGAQLAVLGAIASVLVLAFAGGTASAGTIHVFSESFTADSGAHALSEPAGVAVNDETGDVYVVDTGNKRVEEFNSTGTVFIAEFAPPGGFSSPAAIAVDNSGSTLDPSKGDVYVTDTGDNAVDKFSATGEYKGKLTGACENTGEVAVEPGACPASASKQVTPFSQLYGVAVDTSGAVWVEQARVEQTEQISRSIFSYSNEEPAKFLSSRGSSFPGGPAFAVDSHDNLYFSHAESEPFITKLNSAGQELIVYLNKEASSAVAVNMSNDNVLVDHGANIGYFNTIPNCIVTEQCYEAPAGSLIESFGEGHLEESAGIAVNSSTGGASSGRVYATDRSSDAVRVFQEVPVPDVATGTVSQPSETSEILRGTVNPSSVPVSECRFEYAEYGTESGVYPHTVACAQTQAEIGSGNEPVQVSAEVSGLKPGLQDNFRLTAGNVNGAIHGSNESFIPFRLLGPAALSLPDGRAYELVSTIEGTEVHSPASGQPDSVNEQEGELEANQGGFRAGARGETVAYDGGLSPSGVGGFGVSKNGNGNLYLSERGASGWSESNIEPVPANRQIEGFSADLSQQFININEPQFNETHGQSGSCEYIYARSGGVGVAAFQSLATGAATTECATPTFAGTSADDSHLLLQSPDAYTQGAVKGQAGFPEQAFGTRAAEGYDNLYDSVAGRLYQVNIMPDGEPEHSPYATFGGRLYAGLGVEQYEHNLANDISVDGSRIFWTRLRNRGNEGLYVRENDTQPQSGVVGEACTEPAKACTIQLDRAQPGAEGRSGGGTFWTSSRDGSRAFFTDCHRLTVGSTAVTNGSCSEEIGVPHGGEARVPAGNDLYEYDLESGRLTDLTVDQNGSDALGADVQGVIGASEDGSYVYFVANGVLAGENPEARKPVSGQPNLYVSHDGETSFVATLELEDERFAGVSGSENPNESVAAGDWRLSPGLRSATISRDGGVVAFMSRSPITGYDNHGCTSIWNAAEARCPEVFVYNTHAGRVFCASCAPSGAPPVAATEHWENKPGGHVAVSGNNTFGLRWLNGEGTQVYFDSSEPLVSRDTNHRQDVYEWESEGSGGCARVEGCVSLLSGGDSPVDAFFLDASEDGRDVFFTSREQLLPDGGGEFVKLYDARVDGGFPELEQACTGTGCQGVPPAPPIFATPSSVTFNGIGNFPPPAVVKSKPKSKLQAKCKKHFVKKKGRCVKVPTRKRTKSTHKGRK